MAAPWDGRLITYLGHGLAAARPATPNIATGLMALWYSTDTSVLSLWTGSWADYSGGFADVPVDGVKYVRLDETWEADPIQTDAPADGFSYIRKDGTWTAMASTPATGGGTTTPGSTEPSYATADQWRVVSLSTGPAGGATGGEFGEIDFFDAALTPISFVGATVTASSEAVGFEATKASDASYASGNGWRYDIGVEPATGAIWEVTFAAPVTPRSIHFYPIQGSNQSSNSWALEYYNGSTWVRLQTFNKLAWSGPSSYDVAPVPADAPITGGEVAAAYVPLAGGTMTGALVVPDIGYDATTWNANYEVPTKNAIRDKIEAILAGATFTGDVLVPDEAYGVGWNGSLEVPTKNAVYDQIEATIAGIPGAYTDENARDAIGAALVGGIGITSTVNDGADTITLDGTQDWAFTLNANATLYIPCEEAMTIDAGVAAIGTGSIAYEKSTTATPSTFSSTTLPATLQAGAWLKVIVTGVSGFKAIHLKRTA